MTKQQLAKQVEIFNQVMSEVKTDLAINNPAIYSEQLIKHNLQLEEVLAEAPQTPCRL